MLSDMNWLAFIGAMALVELTPGPNMGWLTALAAQQGRSQRSSARKNCPSWASSMITRRQPF